MSTDESAIGPFGGRFDAELAREALHSATSIRQCTPRITAATIPKASACILLDLKKCSAPCIGATSEAEYGVVVSTVDSHLSQHAGDVVTHLFERISRLSREERFEEAANVRNQLTAYLRGFARAENFKSFSSLEELIIAKFTENDGGIELAHIQRGRLRSSISVTSRDEIPSALQLLTAQESEPIASDLLFPHATPEEVEMLMRWASDHSARPLRVSGPWQLPTYGASFHKNKVERLAKPDESVPPSVRAD